MPDIDRLALPQRWPWLDIGPQRGMLLAAALVAAIAGIDYATGYEQRFSILYLLPIGIATWAGDYRYGLAASLGACLCWFLSFHTGQFYSMEIYYGWEATVMLISFVAFSLLLDSLHAALRRADERFERVLREMPAGILVTDVANGTPLYANAQLGKMFGPGDIPSGPNEAGPDGDRRFVAEEIRNAADGHWYLVQSGRIPWEKHRTARLRVVSDITAKKQAQALHEQTRLIMEQAARLSASAEVASTLAHEINQPLTAIVSYNDACLRLLARPDADRRDIAATMEKCRQQAMRATGIVQGLRQFARERQMHPEDTQLRDILDEVLDLLRFRLDQAGVTARLTLPPGLPSIRADRMLLVQVLGNLVQNALDAMETTPPAERGLNITAGLDGADRIRISVADRGAGLTDEALERIGTPFFTTKPQGLGLGLSICRSVVEAHGGRLWPERGPERGAVFHITLPLKAVP